MAKMIMSVFGLVGVDLAVVLVVTLAVGATAPRWPGRWLSRDRGPLRLSRMDDERTYRRFGVHTWGRRLPEAGGVFGSSKRHLSGGSREALAAYLVEVRRAEWVHWLSLVGLGPLAAFNPLWLWTVFAVIAIAVNAPFVVVLRRNRVRVLRLLARLTR
jgi:glycosyl-4,4'-diaponeurosporenoate acyltransferase